MSLEHFAPKTIAQCKDIKKELEKVANENQLDIQEVWFEILKTSIFVKPSAKDEFSEALSGELQQLEEDEYYEKKELLIYQAHDIRVKALPFERFFKVEVSAEADSLDIVLDDCFIVLDNEEYFQEIFGYIKECMAFEGVIMRQLPKMYERLKTLLRQYKDKKITSKRLNLQTSSHFIPNVEEKPIFLLEEEYIPTHKAPLNEEESAPRECYYASKENQVVARVAYPKQGVNGRNLKGFYIEVPKAPNTPTPIGYDKNFFEEKNQAGALIYCSKALQYVKMEKGRLVAKRDFEFEEMKSTNTPNLLGGVESGITLEIKAKDALSDAIDSNVILEASTINVRGNVGKDVILVADEIMIEGQVHHESYIYANKVHISNHKGVCYAKEFECKYLERGKVYADNVKMQVSAGSVIYAKHIELEKLKSDNKLYFSEQCLIDEVDGNGNRFIFYAFGGRENQEKLKEAKILLNQFGLKSKKIISQHQVLSRLVQNNQETMQKLKNATEEIRRSLMQQASVKEAYNEFMIALRRLKILKAQMLELQKLHNECYAKLVSIENSMPKASILTKSPFKQENIVIYHRNYPKVSNLTTMLNHNENVNIVYEPKENKIKKLFKGSIAPRMGGSK
ncbi:FapA family protein [Helicobacter cetorum]|uniref:FapA family protein n=1 Tax=Helicobacter cetorum TaxID=138563 RepID=UPI000CF0568D|nr:FapA family protein [Helicobacter cetorum]